MKDLVFLQTRRLFLPCLHELIVTKNRVHGRVKVKESQFTLLCVSLRDYFALSVHTSVMNIARRAKQRLESNNTMSHVNSIACSFIAIPKTF